MNPLFMTGALTPAPPPPPHVNPHLPHPPVRFGLVGFGAWGQLHAQSIAGNPAAQLVAIVAPSAASREAEQIVAAVFAMLAKVGYTRENLAVAEEQTRKATELAASSAQAWAARIKAMAALGLIPGASWGSCLVCNTSACK